MALILFDSVFFLSKYQYIDNKFILLQSYNLLISDYTSTDIFFGLKDFVYGDK